jgi:hypothetical protein
MTDEEKPDIDVRDMHGETVDEPDLPNMDRFVRQQRNRITETVYFIYDVRDGSEMFDDLPENTSYVTAISGTGEWSPHKTRKDAVQSLHPWAKWSDTETRLMEVKAIIDRLTICAQECLAGNLKPERLSEVAEMLILEAEEHKQKVLPKSMKKEETNDEEE